MSTRIPQCTEPGCARSFLHEGQHHDLDGYVLNSYIKTDGSAELKQDHPVVITNISADNLDAPGILTAAVETMRQRGRQYNPGDADKPDARERHMRQVVELFNALRGQGFREGSLSELDGWVFMICLKLVRGYAGSKAGTDTWVDLAAYAALAGEAAARREKT